MSWDAVKLIVGLMVTLFLNFIGVAWLASGVSSKADNNAIKIEKLDVKQEDMHTTSIANTVVIKSIAKQLDKVDDRTQKIWDKLK